MKKLFLYIMMNVTFLTIYSFGEKTIFGIRSQGLDGALELAGFLSLADMADGRLGTEQAGRMG